MKDHVSHPYKTTGKIIALYTKYISLIKIFFKYDVHKSYNDLHYFGDVMWCNKARQNTWTHTHPSTAVEVMISVIQCLSVKTLYDARIHHNKLIKSFMTSCNVVHVTWLHRKRTESNEKTSRKMQTANSNITHRNNTYLPTHIHFPHLFKKNQTWSI